MQINLDVSLVIRIVLLFLVQEQGGGGGNTCTRQIYALLFGGWGRQRGYGEQHGRQKEGEKVGECQHSQGKCARGA